MPERWGPGHHLGYGHGRTGAAQSIPCSGGNQQATDFTLQSALTCTPDATYTYTIQSEKEQSSHRQAVANGVTINGGSFVFQGTAQGALKRGLTLTAISNTAATPVSAPSAISPRRDPDCQRNNFQANYEAATATTHADRGP